MKKVKAYITEYFDGNLNGAIRYYDTLAKAKRAANAYVTRNRNYPEAVGYYIYELYEDYTKKVIISK